MLKVITERIGIGDIPCKDKVAFQYETSQLDLISLSEILCTLVLAMSFLIRTSKMILIISVNVCPLEAQVKNSAQQSPKLSKLVSNQIFLSRKTTT